MSVMSTLGTEYIDKGSSGVRDVAAAVLYYNQLTETILSITWNLKLH